MGSRRESSWRGSNMDAGREECLKVDSLIMISGRGESSFRVKTLLIDKRCLSWDEIHTSPMRRQAKYIRVNRAFMRVDMYGVTLVIGTFFNKSASIFKVMGVLTLELESNFLTPFNTRVIRKSLVGSESCNNLW